MKKLLFLLFIMLSTKVFAFQSDTTIVEFEDKSFRKKFKIVTKDGETFVYPRLLNLKSVLKAFDVDSLEREKVWTVVSKSKNSVDTLVVINRSGNSVKITSRNVGNDIFSYDDDEIKTYEPLDKKAEFDVQITVDGSGPKGVNSPSRFFSRRDFAIYLGLNSYTNQATQAPNNLSDLRVWPSRYIALSFRGNATLANSEKTHWVLSYGPEIAWHNFMLQNSNILKYENGQAMFVENSRATTKSKFVVPHLNFPVMVHVGLKKEKIRLGLGGYVGYRIGGYTKEKFSGGKNRDNSNGSLGLNDLKYGLTAEVGKKNGGALFIRYDLSDLFRSNQIYVKDMQAFSFGVRL